MRCFYDPGYCFPLPEEHPFPMDKFWRAEAMIRAAQRREIEILPVEPATEAQLRRVHTETYLDKIRSNTLTREESVKLGLPAGEALLARCQIEVGGTIAAARAAQAEGVACNLAGGTHHAFPDRGLGYCVLNDVAIAIRELHASQPNLRIFVIDTDAHQGNGTHGIFADEKRVFTYSIHVGKNYPATKTPGCIDLPLPRYVQGLDYLEQLEATLGPALDDFAPNLAFWISGADIHEHDRFGQMRLSSTDILARDHHVLTTIYRRRIPTAVLYGGGYNQDRTYTARLHANTVLLATDFAARWRV